MSESTGNELDQIELADIREINDGYLAYLSGITVEEIEARSRSVTGPTDWSANNWSEARDILLNHGIVVFPGVVSRDSCKKAGESIGRLIRDYSRPGVEYEETEDVLFQIGTAKLKGYYQLSNYGKTVVTIRQGQDQGMVDIFNCDYALQDSLEPIRHVFEDGFMRRIVGSLAPANLNVYVNEGIEKTRGFHVDSYGEHMKAFIYLTDVLTLADGPYTYVLDSHKPGPFQRFNRAIASQLVPATETPLVDLRKMLPVLAPAGSLVVSDQSGAHRGFPQSPGRKRKVAVMKYA